MTKTEEIGTLLKAFLKLGLALVIATVAISFLAWALTGFEGELGPYPYTNGKLF